MKLYVARDENGELYLYTIKPKRSVIDGVFATAKSYRGQVNDLMRIPDEELPAVTWKNSPQLVEVEIYHEPEKIES